MTPPLPPLNAVRAFAAAARHQSFTRAAVELHVTHSAVSRQIKSLEDHLGVALFERRIRQVSLTAAGRQFFEEVEPALNQIAAAAHLVMARGSTRSVRINVRPTFAVRWLIPRLPSFVAEHPGIEPQVVTSTVNPDNAVDAYDVAIRRGLKGWPPSMQLMPFLEDDATVVGAASLFNARPVAEPKALGEYVLLSSKTRPDDWSDWRKQAGSPRLQPANHLQFDHLHFVLQAALDGLGFAIAPRSLLAHDLALGRLASPLPGIRLPLTRYYYAAAPDAAAETRLFIRWLEKEQQQDASLHARNI